MNSLIKDKGILFRMLQGRPRQGTHRERLNTFYAPQANSYDRFREKLLHGRQSMLDKLDLAEDQVIVELGAGTARNLEFYANLIPQMENVYAVDLCLPLISEARKRCSSWSNVDVIEADASLWKPPMQVDRVYFSYALTMMPNWREVIQNAWDMLKPGGLIGAVDFYTSEPGCRKTKVAHSRFIRSFWPLWFRHDGVYLDADRITELQKKFKCLLLDEHMGAVPYLPRLKVPYYFFIGQKQ